jgi:predicted permease
MTDLLHAARTLTRTRAFTAVCVVSLGLGMSVIIAVLLLMRFAISTPPGVHEDGLVEFVIRPGGVMRAEAGTSIVDTWSFPDYLDLRDAAGVLTLSGWSSGEGLVRPPDQQAERPVPAMYVSSNYFSTLGVPLARGRGFTPVHDASHAPLEAVISHRMWQLLFAGDPHVIGRSLTINQSGYVVVGIAPEKFRGHVSGLGRNDYSLWLPLSHHTRLSGADNVRASRDARWVRAIGRLPAGMPLAQADAMVHAAMAGLSTRYPATNKDKAGGVETYFAFGAAKRSQAGVAQAMTFGLSGLVLLVVGLNISGMMLVRGAMRERELAIRMAIGASRWRLMRYHLSEALVLAVAGGSLASALLFGVPAIVAWSWNLTGAQFDLFVPDVRIVLQCIVLCFVTSLVLGALPALRFSRPALLSTLRSDASGRGRRVGRLQRLTAAAQAGLAIPFLVIGGIKLDQAREAATGDLGFTARGLYAVRLNLTAIAKTEEERSSFLRTVQEGLGRAAGVTSVSVADGVPLDADDRYLRIAREGEATFTTVHTTRVDADYLATLGIRLLAGRGVDRGDQPGAEWVVMLSEPLARQLFPAGDALGRRLVFASTGGEPRTYTIVGVTADVVSTEMGNPRLQLFLPLAQHQASKVLVIARGAGSATSMRHAYETALRAADPDYLLTDLITGDGLVDNSHFDLLTHSAVGGGLAGVALILAALGVYGVIAFMVATRTREIGVRLALGASRARVLREVLGDALKLVVPGIALGLVAAVFWVRVADPSWYPLGGVEPAVYSAAAATAFLVAIVAGIPSARRAAAVQPIVAMRIE